ncbi:MAG: ABC transporter permease [Spirochaetaceae bacterium]|nr:MAG: ABC transporter permease [Spirochaetaceae bacterium]
MLQFILRRVVVLIPTIFFIALISFVIIQLPPGDYVSTVEAQLLRETGEVSQAELAALRARYGLDRPMIVRFFIWFSRVLQGDFGRSFQLGKPVSEVIGERLGLTVLISFLSTMFAWAIAFPIGVYSAVKQHSLGDGIATVIGYIGLAVPNFMLALMIMYVAVTQFGQSVGGLFSPQFIDAPWSFAKFVDMVNHLWIPMIVIGTAGTAGLIRVLRNNLLDELNRPYVTTARAKGYKEVALIFKFPVRLALIPFISTVGWMLPAMVSGETIVAIVLNLPTVGPVLLGALRAQDYYLAGAFIMFLAILTVIGTLISDILLAITDPRIRY